MIGFLGIGKPKTAMYMARTTPMILAIPGRAITERKPRATAA